MTIVHLIHGFLGSGKTTFAKALEAETNAIRFSPDEWMIALYGSNPPADLFQEYHARIMDFIWLQIAKTTQAGVDAILDLGFWTRASRNDAIARVKAFGAVPKLYALQTPFEVSQERVLRRTADMPDGALFIDQNAIDLFWSKFEPLQDDEEAARITTP